MLVNKVIYYYTLCRLVHAASPLCTPVAVLAA